MPMKARKVTMSKKTAIMTFFLLSISMLALNAYSQAPNTIMYQGRLTNPDGAPLTDRDVDSVHFYIETGGLIPFVLYDTTVTDLNIDNNGVFTVELGPVPETVFSGYKRYLSLRVNTDPLMSPKQPLTSVPYAMNVAGMPGIASGYTSNVSNLTSTAVAVDSAVVDCPTRGYVAVMASGYFYVTHTYNNGDQVTRASIGTARASINYSNFAYHRIPSASPSGIYGENFSLVATFNVSASGTHKYFLNADVYDAGTFHPANSDVSDGHIVAMFFPVAYGEVDATKLSGQSDIGSSDALER
jgi:hypothetical protein